MRHQKQIALLLIVFVSLAAPGVAQTRTDAKKKPAKVVEAKIGETRNVHQCGSLYLAGQPTEDDIALLKKAGVRRVITLRTEGEVDWDQAGKLKAAGIEFVAIPFRAPDTLTPKVFDKIRKLLAESKKTPTMLHCGSANRVGAVWMAYRTLDEGVSLEQARKEAKEVGLRTPAYEEKALEYIKAKAKKDQPPKQSSVKPGINQNFLDPEMKIEQWIGRFETESREIFKNRNAILAAMPVKQGMQVADIGAGTGFFTRLLAEQVGENGGVYAVDISPTFITHISQTAEKLGVGNITPVLSAGDNVRLPANSVDLVHICDTYHHFEYPAATLATIHKSLRPNGVLVVIDFNRIPGVSREFILGHVRADKETFRREIEAAGFAFLREAKVDGLKENYFLMFRKR